MPIQTIMQIITFVIAVGGVAFSVFLYFQRPAIKSEQNDALMLQQIESLRSKVELLINNDIHELKGKLDRQGLDMNTMAVQLGRLEAIIDERVPRRTT